MKLLFENWRQYLTEAANPVTIKKIQDAIKQAGGESYITGGAVRDSLIPGAPESKDVDFLVTGLPIDAIIRVLRPLAMGRVDQVGKSFGVIIANIDGEDFDVAIPRVGEEKTGEKHTDVKVTTDYKAPISADLSRRDFTINAMVKDTDGNIVDMFGGREDIQNKVIRAVGDPEERFTEDPLRMLRALQFATRFEFDIEEKTAAAIKKSADKFKTLSPERVLEEFKKAWTKGKRDTERFIKLLDDLGIGKILFGSDFQPEYVKLEGDAKDLAHGNFIAFFLKGGDPTALRPTNDMKRYLQLAQKALKDDRGVFEYAGRDSDKLPLIAQVLKTFDKEVADKIEKALKLPMTPKELAIGGRELMSLGLKGNQIGLAQKEILRAIHNDEIDNNIEDIEDFLQRSYNEKSI